MVKYMKRFFEKTAIILLCAVLTVQALPMFATAASAAADDAVTILFTHDLHSHFLPVKTEDGGQSGGYARLYSLLSEARERYAGSPVITVDGGDFSMGSLFQTIFASTAAELRILGEMDYDAVTLGNHEFDFRQAGLAAMLKAAVASGDQLPYIVQANYRPDDILSDEYDADDAEMMAAMTEYGVKEYTVIEREGVRFAVFGLIGKEADSNAPLSGMVLEDPITAAAQVVADIKANADADYIICLSHCGTDEYNPTSDKTEDYKLARAVKGIDVIVSGHTHSVLSEPVAVNGTLIVSAGEYAENLGELRIKRGSDGGAELVSYSLIPVDEKVPDDAEIAAIIEDYKTTVVQNYLAGFEGMAGFDKVIAETAFNLDKAGGQLADKAIGNLITESYVYAVEKLAGASKSGDAYDTVDFAVIASGVIRDTLRAGEITVSEAFNTLSLGIGADGSPGYPLISVYLTGRELKSVFEIDTQLYGTGLFWQYNTYRVPLNKVTYCAQEFKDIGKTALIDDRLYHVVTGQYCGQMLAGVTGLTHGLISIIPKDKNGEPINDGGTFDSRIIYQADGSELKEWYAFASYLSSFDDADGDGVADIPDTYREPKYNKVVYSSLSPIELVKNPNVFTIAAAVIALILIIVLLMLIIKLLKAIFTRRVRVHKHPKKYRKKSPALRK